jgi:ABC-2 type transport system permease protein
MRQTLIVAGQELWFNLRRPGFIIMTAVFPLLGVVGLLLASLFGGEVGGFIESQFEPKTQATGYVDHSGLLKPEEAAYAGEFVAFEDEASARTALLSDQIGSYFVLGEDYLQTGKVTVFGKGGGFSTFVAADEGNLRQFLVASLVAGRLDATLQARAIQPMDLETITLDEQGSVSTEDPFSMLGDFVLPYIFAIVFVITIFTTSGFLLQSVSEEKEGRIIEILLSSISSTQLLAGKILGLGALGLVQILIWIGAGAALLGAAAALFSLVGADLLDPVTVGLGLVYFVLGYLLFATLMAVAGSMGTTQRESQQIASIFSLAAALPWMTMGVVFTNPHAPLAVVLSLFPLTAPVMMLLRLGISDVPAGEIVASIALLVLGIAFSLWAGAKVFRVGLLMYGKRPSLKDLSRAFKQA